MSFMDPDYRERLQKESEAKRQQCKIGGHEFNTKGTCSRCGGFDGKPRVTLSTPDYRAVYNPNNSVIVIEKRSTDSLGADRWDEIDRVTSSHAKSEPSRYHIYLLLRDGK